MRGFVLFVLLLAVAIGALGYWRGWFTVTDKEGKRDVEVHQTTFDQDKKAFSKSVGEKAKALRSQVDKLWEHSKGLSGDARTQAQKDLGELQTKHDRIEQQIK